MDSSCCSDEATWELGPEGCGCLRGTSFQTIRAARPSELDGAVQQPEPFLETQGMCKKVVGGPGLTVPGQPSPDIDILF